MRVKQDHHHDGTRESAWWAGLEMPDHGIAWLKVPTDGSAIRCIGVSNPASWRCHFVRVHDRGRVYGARCLEGETRCRLCGMGNLPRVRYVLAVAIEQTPHLLEVGAPQWNDLLRAGAGGGFVGRPLVLWRERPGKTGRIRLERDVLTDPVEDPELLPRVDLEQIVHDLGRAALARVLALLSPSSEPPPRRGVPGEGPGQQAEPVVVHGNGTGPGTGPG